jgi:putative tryptophan/tyrosine transport system substrate-binding protein
MWYSAVGCLVTLALSLLVAPLLAMAQPTRKVPTIGFLHHSSATDSVRQFEAFQQGLRELGYIEGQNIAIEQRYVESRPERLPALAANSPPSTSMYLW